MAVANIDDQLPPIVAPSAMKEAISEHNSFSGERGSLLLHDQKADFEGREQKPHFDTRKADEAITHQAKLEELASGVLSQFDAAQTRLFVSRILRLC